MQIIGVPPKTQLLRIEQHDDHNRIWIRANTDFKFGTYINLYHSGRIEKVVVHEDNTESYFEIKK